VAGSIQHQAFSRELSGDTHAYIPCRAALNSWCLPVAGAEQCAGTPYPRVLAPLVPPSLTAKTCY
jgi:hypothetical protein